jgi:TonB family protein
MRKTIFFIAILSSLTSCVQNKNSCKEIQVVTPTASNDSDTLDEIYAIVQVPPSFPGGEDALDEFISSNLKFPEAAMQKGIQGTVFVTFVVEKNGSVSNVRILRGLGFGCDEEAIRIVQSFPAWNPGTQRKKPMRVQCNVPIRFILDH